VTNFANVGANATPIISVRGGSLDMDPSGMTRLTGSGTPKLRVTDDPVFRAVADPGNAGAIPVYQNGECALVTGGAETRTLAAPTFVGQELTLYMKTDGGNCVVTCATTINETGNNTITFANTGEAVRLFAVEEGATLRWRCAQADGAVLSTA
jgi:hypothetical protein